MLVGPSVITNLTVILSGNYMYLNHHLFFRLVSNYFFSNIYPFFSWDISLIFLTWMIWFSAVLMCIFYFRSITKNFGEENDLRIRNFHAKPIVAKNTVRENSAKFLLVLNSLFILWGMIDLSILTYFFFRADIIFHPTGYFAIPTNIPWYFIFVSLIFFKIFFILKIRQAIKHIKNLSHWIDKKKKNAINALTLLNICGLFLINFPLVNSFYSLMNEKEVLSQNIFWGTFRRILTAEERKNLVQDLFEKFLENVQASKNVKENFSNWFLDNFKVMMEPYTHGTEAATKFLSEKFQKQIEILIQKEIEEQRISMKNQALLEKSSSSWFDILNSYCNPWVAEQKDFLLFVGGCLLLIGAGVLYFSYCNQQVLSQRLNTQQNEIYNLRSNFRQMNSQNETMQSQIYFDQTAIDLILESLSRRPGLLRPPGAFRNLRRPHILTQDRIGEITAAMLRKYGNQPLNTLEVCEFINLLYYP